MITSLSPASLDARAARLALGQNDRLDDLGHELGLPARQLGSLGAHQDGLGEALVGHHIELAGAVVGVEGIVACTVFNGIDAAGLAEEFAQLWSLSPASLRQCNT